MAERMLGVLATRGSEHVLLVHGHDGLDELTTTTTSTVHELETGSCARGSSIRSMSGFRSRSLTTCAAATPQRTPRSHAPVLGGERGPARDVVVLNAGAALVAAGTAVAVADGMAQAEAAIDDGRAAAALDRLVAASQLP